MIGTPLAAVIAGSGRARSLRAGTWVRRKFSRKGGENMTDQNISDVIRQKIAEQLDRNLEEVTDEASFVDDLGADSLDQTELLMALEEEFDIEIDDDANEIATVGEAIEYVKSKLN
jgi:acyl carrier protein